MANGLVDLPGYGYAEVPEEMKRKWQRALGEYLEKRQSLQGLVVLMAETPSVERPRPTDDPVGCREQYPGSGSADQSGQTGQRRAQGAVEYGT